MWGCSGGGGGKERDSGRGARAGGASALCLPTEGATEGHNDTVFHSFNKYLSDPPMGQTRHWRDICVWGGGVGWGWQILDGKEPALLELNSDS